MNKQPLPPFAIFAVCCVAFTIGTGIYKTVELASKPKPTTKWYGGEILISIQTNNTNYNAKINEMELGLRSDGVIVYRHNPSIQPPIFK